ncbi:MAG: hypothetical protein J6Y98_03120 [Bacteroidales bacterium]|nr:hypothetical protein [Bacteroidales bacterium]
MKQQPELESLFAAAQRQKKDAQRQQQLSDLIDQLASKETSSTRRRHRLWTITSIAASFLLLIGIGFYTLLGHSTDMEQNIVAENKGETTLPTPDKQPITFTPSDSQQITVPTRHLFISKQDETTSTEPDSIQIIEQPVVIEEEQIVPVIHSEQEKQVLVAENHDEPKVFTRTSSRLVCGAGCKSERTTDVKQLAVINLSGAGTEFELNAIPF